MALRGLVITGQAGHTLEVEPPPPPPPNFFFLPAFFQSYHLPSFFQSHHLLKGFTNCVCVCVCVHAFELVPRQIRFALNSGSN